MKKTFFILKQKPFLAHDKTFFFQKLKPFKKNPFFLKIRVAFENVEAGTLAKLPLLDMQGVPGVCLALPEATMKIIMRKREKSAGLKPSGAESPEVQNKVPVVPQNGNMSPQIENEMQIKLCRLSAQDNCCHYEM